MELNTTLSGHYPRYHCELRILFASTSADCGPERDLLLNTVLPELRREARERGVLLVVSDPRLEVSMAPGRAEAIEAARMDELHGYRPVFIGILGGSHSPAPPRDAMPWLHGMDDGESPQLAMRFIESAMQNPLMLERMFLYIPELAVHAGREIVPENLQRLRALAHDGGFSVRGGMADQDALGRAMLEDLLAVLDRLHPSGENLSLLDRWRRSQEIFAAPHRRAYEELPGHFDRLDRHAAELTSPLFITGGTGAGKSALLANWVAYHRTAMPDIPVICHHVGALSVESSHTYVLRHILAELKEIFAIPDPLPESTAELATTLPLWLERSEGRRVVIAIDGLNHLDPASHSLDWLPPDLPENIRLLLSTSSDEGGAAEIFGLLTGRNWEEYPLPPLTLAQQRAVMGRIVAESGGDLDPDLLGRFTLGGAVSIPLFLRMSVCQLQQTSGRGERDKLLATRTQEEFLDEMFDQLESHHGAWLVREVMSYIWGSRTGMHETELRALTGAGPAELSALLASVDHYLAKRGDLLRFIHSSVRDTVGRRYLPNPAEGRKVHHTLAGYFASESYTLRRAEEEPWQWEQAGERGRLAECLADIEMFKLLSTEDRRHELRQYWAALKDERLLVRSYDASFAAWRAHTPDTGEQAAVADRLGIFLMLSGLYDHSERYLRLALLLEEERYGTRALETASTLHSLAELLRQTGKFSQAEEHYLTALSILEEHPELPRLPVAQVLSDLGLLYRDWGHHQSALAFYGRAVELKEQACGADHPQTAESLNDLALLYYDLRELEKAIPLYRRSLEIRERRLGRNHPATATSLNNLAGACRNIGDLDEAQRLYYRALEIREKMLGADHPNTIITVSNIASLLQARKRYDDSKKMMDRAINATVKRLGEAHPTLIMLRTSYAYLERDSGNYEAAEQQLRQTIAIARQALGEHHPSVAVCANNLAVILRTIKRNDEAATLYKEAIASWEISLGPEHPHVGDALETLALIDFERNDLDASEAHAGRALKIQTRVLGPDHASTKMLIDLLARIQQMKSDLREQE